MKSWKYFVGSTCCTNSWPTSSPITRRIQRSNQSKSDLSTNLLRHENKHTCWKNHGRFTTVLCSETKNTDTQVRAKMQTAIKNGWKTQLQNIHFLACRVRFTRKSCKTKTMNTQKCKKLCRNTPKISERNKIRWKHIKKTKDERPLASNGGNLRKSTK